MNIRYYRWKIRKTIKEAQANAKEFRIIVSPERPKWKTDLAYYYDAFVYVTKHGMYGQTTQYGSISVPKPFKDIDEAIEFLVKWIVQHPMFRRWRVSWEAI